MNRDVLIDAILPEYSTRHVFAMKLRLVAFLGFWALYLYFMRGALPQTKVVAIVVLVSFLVTGFAYYNVMRAKWLVSSFVVELFCDLTALTAVLYLTGGPHSAYYTIYILYVLLAGILYNHYLAGILAFVTAAYYAVFLLLCHYGVIPPLILYYGDRAPIPTYTPFAHFLLACVLLAAIVYTVKIATYFSQRREKILERRNRELMALHRMSGTVRSALALRDVIDHILAGVLEGLGLEAAALIHFDRQNNMARLYAPGKHPKHAQIEAVFGRPLEGIEFPLDALSSPFMKDVMKHKIIFRGRIEELLEGFEGAVTLDQCDRIQDILGIKRIVVVPIIVESETLGALVGFSREPFVEEKHVATMEAFADQSALSLEAAMLIDRLRKLNEELKEANQVKSEFLATMSHELRTPLTAIIGFTELIAEGVMGEIASEQKDALKEVLHNAADLLEMINSLLDLTKIESGSMGLELRMFDITETIKRMHITLTPLIQKKKQIMTVDLPDELPVLRGDERKIQQVILNLLANANKFTPEGGHITLAARHHQSWDKVKKVASWWQRFEADPSPVSRGCLEMVVEDDGIGIPPEHLERVFDMFHQADSSSTRNFGGTGLGLALARKFIEMHGGTIWVESELGKGARFTVILPQNAI
ncbi:MAG: GAF domain-containing sensor histidine kinase [Pseudomonadota bacterium]